MKVFIVEGIHRLSAGNVLYNAGLEQDVDYTVVKEHLTNIYEITINEKSSKIIGKMMMLSKV